MVYIAMLYVEMSVSWCNERVETKKNGGKNKKKIWGKNANNTTCAPEASHMPVGDIGLAGFSLAFLSP